VPNEIRHIVVADRLLSRFAAELEDGLDGSMCVHVERHETDRLRAELAAVAVTLSRMQGVAP
jgi:hypothetical protein